MYDGEFWVELGIARKDRASWRGLLLGNLMVKRERRGGNGWEIWKLWDFSRREEEGGRRNDGVVVFDIDDGVARSRRRHFRRDAFIYLFIFPFRLNWSCLF